MFSSSGANGSSYQCGHTTISDGNGSVQIVGQTFADAVRQANLLQPALFRSRNQSDQVVKVVFGADRVTVNVTRYPLSSEAIGFSLDGGTTIKPMLLEGSVYPPMRFSPAAVAVVFTDGDTARWGEAWINPKKKSITFKP